MTRARDLANLGDNTSKLEQASLIQVVPSSVAVGSGTGSVSTKGTVTISGASTVSLNDVFSSSYDRYKIIINQTGASVTNGQLQMRLRVAGSDNSATNYREQYIGADSTTVFGGRSTGISFWFIGRVLNDHRTWVELDIINPFDSSLRPTFWNNYNDTITGTMSMVSTSGALDVTTSYTGFTVIAETGNMTGSIYVYGYNK
jgi:hypothetical protein